jgi:hypothetical protein
MENNKQLLKKLVYKLGYIPVLENYRKMFGFESFDAQSVIPIGYSKFDRYDTCSVYLSENIKEYIQNVIGPCTNAVQNPCEIPFFLLGSYGVDNGQFIINLTDVINGNTTERLESTKATYNAHAISEVKRKAKEQNYSVVVIGHSHTRLTSEMEEYASDNIKAARTHTRQISDEIGIRESGMNLSIQDIEQLIVFTRDLNMMSRKTIAMSCIYHFNGEINFMFYNNYYEKVGLIGNVYYKLNNGLIEDVKCYSSQQSIKGR